jgi:simple sugar transport system permease protein
MTTAGAMPAIPKVPTDERVARRSLLTRLLIRPEFGAVTGAIVVWLLFAWQAGSTWMSWQGTKTYLEASALLGLSALAVALLMIGGEFDLSSGVLVGTSGMFAALFAVHAGWHVIVSMVFSLLIAIGIGTLNGVMVVMSKLPSFIVTLGVLFGLRGFNLWLTQRVTNQTQVTGLERADGFEFGRRLFAGTFIRVGGVGFRAYILWFVVLAIVGYWVLARTKVGNWIFAVGGNKEAARMVGVPATATKIGLFIAVAVSGWIHGMAVLFQTTRSNVQEGVGQEFFYIIAAVLGGCLLTGGYGSVVGAAFGILILGMTQLGINLAGWDNNLYFLFLGVILLIAAFSNEAIRRWASTAARPPSRRLEQVAEEGERDAAATAAMVEADTASTDGGES